MGLGTRRVFLFFFFFWIWLLITSSWDSISLPLPCFSCFLSSRVFLRPSVGWRRDDLSSCPSIWWLCNSLEFLVSCHKWRFSVSSRSSAIFQGRCHPPWSRLCVALSGSWAVISDPYSLPSFCPVWPEGPCWWSCASRGQCHFRSVSQSCDFMSSISSSEELTLGTYVHLHQLSLTAQLMTLFFWHIFSLSFSSHLVFSWYANEGPPFWSFLPCFPGVSSAGPWCCFSSVFFGCSNYVYLPLPQWNVCIVFITYADMP